MQYNIRINQKALFDNKLLISVDSACILDFVVWFTNSPNCQRLIHENKEYYWISHKLIMEELPILNLNTERTVRRRMQELVDSSILVAHPDNSVMARSYYCMGKNYSRIFSDTDSPIDTTMSQPLPKKTKTIPAPLKKPKTVKKGEAPLIPNNLHEANMFRQPRVPLFEEVHRTFVSNGGDKEMADSFFLKYQSTGWFLNGSPIINFASLVGSYVKNWKVNNAKTTQTKNKNGYKTDEQIQQARSGQEIAEEITRRALAGIG